MADPDGRALTVVSSTELSTAALDAVYTDLLVPAFPPEELVDRDAFHAVYGGAAVPGLVALDGDAPVGIAAGELHEPTGIALLGYLAVSGGRRSGGVGTLLLRHVRSSWGSRPTTTAVLAEVEDPRGRHATRYGDPVARLRFYGRAGARVLPVDYFQPRLRPDLPRVPGMLLLSLLADRPDLRADDLMAFLDDHLVEAEGVRPLPDDEQYARMRASVRRCGATVPAAPVQV